MYIEDLKLNKKQDILLMDNIGEIIRRYINLDSVSKKSKISHYEISQINQNNKLLLKYTFFYKDFVREFLVDDYHVVEVLNNKIKHDDVLNASFNLFMCKQMNKRIGDNSYLDNLIPNLNNKEIKTFNTTLQMHMDLVDLYEYYERKNTMEE